MARSLVAPQPTDQVSILRHPWFLALGWLLADALLLTAQQVIFGGYVWAGISLAALYPQLRKATSRTAT